MMLTFLGYNIKHKVTTVNFSQQSV